MNVSKLEEFNKSDKYVDDFEEINDELIEEMEIKKNEFNKKYESLQVRLYEKMIKDSMYMNYLGYIPNDENPNKRKQESKKKKAKKRRIKRNSKRKNRR